MLSCIDCRNLLLDHLYGLLDEPEAVGLRAHLAGCPACRADQATAAAQQHLLAKAAQVYGQVPLFHAPADETPLAPTAAPATLPLPVRPRRSLRRWLGAAVAAALVLLAVWGWREYDRGLRLHESDLVKLRQEAAGVQDRFVQLCTAYEIQQKEAPAQVEKQFLQLQVLGPGDLQPGVANAYHVVTGDVHGQRRRALVTVSLLDQKDGKVLGSWPYDSPGTLDVVVPADALEKVANPPLLVIEARTPTAREEIRQSLPLARPVHVSQLVLNQTAFRPGERVFFRSLTLERFSLRPPTAAAEEWEVDYRLLSADGKVMRRFGATTKKGIAGGDFQLDGFLSPGTYTLSLTAVDPSGKRLFVPTQRHIAILHHESPLIVFDQPQYGPNEKVNGQVYGRRAGGQVVNGQKVMVAATVGGKPVSVNGLPPGLPAPAQMDATGKANFHLQVPPSLTKETNAVVKATLSSADKREEVEQTLKLVPTPVTVKLFPEGGDLVPGVVNRIYYRAETAKGLPAQVEGQVFGPNGAELARFASKAEVAGDGKPGMGSFQMTPPALNQLRQQVKNADKDAKNASLGEAFQLVVKSPQGDATTTERLPMQTRGVALQVAEAVCREGQPLVVQLRDPEPDRRLLVAVACRGRLVAQQYVVAPPEGTTVRLTPAPGARGVLRLTVYDAAGKGLRPLAERLLFCKPAATLELNAVCLNAPPKGGFKAGDQVGLRIHSKAKDAVVLAAVVKETATGTEANLGIRNPLPHFFLATELEHPEDLENAEVFLGDAPEAAPALDLFLGTHGWRRFLHPGNPVQLPLLSADNRTRIQAASKEALNHTRQRLWDEVEQERTALKEERQRRAAAAQDAAVALATYQELPRQYGRLAALLAMMGLFGLFLLGVVAVLVQTVRGLPTPRILLGGAGLALLLCGLTYVGTSELRLGGKPAEPQVALGLLRSEWRPLAEPELTKVQTLRQDRAAVDLLGLAVHQNLGKMERGKGAATPQAAMQVQRNRQLQERSVLLAYGGGGFGGAVQDLRLDSQAKMIAPTAINKKSDEKASAPSAEGKFQEGGAGNKLRQFAFQGKGPAPDLLLWQPELLLTNGSAVVQFSLPMLPGSYRILLYGNTPDGRLGFSQSRLATENHGAAR